ncbi:MAG: TetR/AcrR family transcriptional regulator [Polyangiales bacterium]|nr:TetR/AcrR family transcriptional regulator [Myxococcales bacterium]MCB9656201.1 TetR/AcrR family transcriptional regulator [Sandaracinaceae bacterium]
MAAKKKAARGPGRPRSGEAPALDTEECLRVALRVFADTGFEAASIRDIARRLGVSHALLRHHFGSKQQIWEATVDFSFGSMNRELTARLQHALTSRDLRAGLRSLIVEYVRLSAVFPDNLTLLMHESALGGERMQYIVDRHVRAFVQVARGMVRHAQAEGALRDAPWQAIFFLVFTGGPAVFAMSPLDRALDDGGASPSDDVERYAEAIATIVLDGILRVPADTGAAQSR